MECLNRLCEVVVSPCFMEMDIMSDWGILLLPSIVKPKPVGKVLTRATVSHARVDGIKVNVCTKIGLLTRLSVMWLELFYLNV